MLHQRCLSLCATSVLALVIAAPAVAQQLSAKDVWSQLRQRAGEAGLAVTSQSVDDFGTSLSVNGLRVFPLNDPRAMVLTMDSLRIEPRGEMVALIPSELVRLETHSPDDSQRTFDIHAAGEVLGALSDTNAALDLDFPSLTMQLVSATRPGRPLDEAFSLALTDFGASLRVAREGSLDLSMGAANTSYEFRYNDTSGLSALNQTGSGAIEGLRIEASGTELDELDDARTVRDAMEAGVTMRLSFSSGPSTGVSHQTMGSTEIDIASNAAESNMAMAFVEGRFEATMSSGAGGFEGGMGPVRGNATFDGVGLDVVFPMVITPDDQRARYAFHFDNVTPSPELLTALGAGQFAGDSLSLALDVGAAMRLVQEIPIDGSDFAASEPPFDLSSVNLDTLLLRVGDSEFTGSGAVMLIGGLMANIGRSMPEAEGDFVFNLVGGERLLTRVQAMGLIPNDQLFFVRMMMNGLGRPVGDDSLQSDLAIRPGGVITVNGAPLPF